MFIRYGYSIPKQRFSIFFALNKIDYYSGPESENVLKLDYLVDYYQSGLSMQIEAMLRGYGYLNVVQMDSALILYDRVSN